jgi:hypothetical protein
MAYPQKPPQRKPGARNVYDWAVKAQFTHIHFHYRLFRERLVLTLRLAYKLRINANKAFWGATFLFGGNRSKTLARLMLIPSWLSTDKLLPGLLGS